MQRANATWLKFLLLAMMIAISAHAEGDRDRKGNYVEAARQGDEETRKQLTPPMQMHFLKAAKHEQNAQEARQNKDEGKAQQEEQMAKQEQMKGQQLQQQIETNKKTADENLASSKLLENNDAIRKSTADLNHVIVDETRKNNAMAPSSAAPETTARTASESRPEPVDLPAVLVPQIAKLDNFTKERQELADRIDQQRAPEPKAATPPAAEETGKPWKAELAQVGPNSSVGFNDAAPSGGSTRADTATLTAPPQNRLLSAASDPLLTSDMPSALPALVRAPSSVIEKKEKEAKDKDFWDAVDGKKAKKKKRAAGALAAGSTRAGGAKGVVRVGKK